MLAVLFASAFKGQTVGKYTYHHKDYLVYPLRIDNSDEIPQAGFRIPDGDYVVFHNYIFKRKRFDKWNTVLHDTAKIVAYVQVKNSLLNGPATIYVYDNNNNLQLKKHPYKVLSGNYRDGQKDSTWRSKIIKTGWYELSDYKNDLLNGYQRSYNAQNQLLYKTKYTNEDKVDTVFSYFENGRLMRSFDYYNTKDVDSYPADVYSLALKHFTQIMTRGAPKTFYRKYDKKGRLLIDLKFKDGQPLPFDSVRTEDKFLQVTNLGMAGKLPQIRIRLERKTLLGTSVNEETYSGMVLTKHTKTEYGARHKDTVYQETEVLPLDTLYDAAVPQLLVRSLMYGVQSQTFYIPRYRFSFEHSPGNGLLAIDPSGPAFRMGDTSVMTGDMSEISQVTCILEDSLVAHSRKYNPYVNKLFLLNEEIPDKSLENGHNRGSDYLYEPVKDYMEINASHIYLKNGKPYSGRVIMIPAFIYDWSKHGRKAFKTDSLQRLNSDSYDKLEKGALLNGRREGSWEQLVGDDLYSVRRDDPKSYFLKHATTVDYYMVNTYRNGIRNGHSELFLGTSMREIAMDFDKSPEQQKALAALLKKNLSASKKEFVYKSEACEFVNDTLDGPYTSYFVNSQPEQVMFFKKGRPHGDYKRYAYTGELMAEGHFNEGGLEGEFYRYYGITFTGADKNFLQMKAVFKNNRLVDTLVYYNLEGHRTMTLQLNYDTLMSRKQYFGDGRLMEDLRVKPGSSFTINEEILESSNYIDIANNAGDDSFSRIDGSYTSYYDNGQVLAEGAIELGYPARDWKFYNINGTLVHQVNFVDTFIVLPGDTGKKEISGLYTGYYSNGKLRCKGYLKDLELSYDCFTRQDKPALDFYVLEFYDFSGRQTVSNGSGYLLKYDENGLKLASGKLVNCIEDSVWKYFTPEQKLTETGTYVKGEKDGIWYEGDLEGINFEDGACFNPNDEYEMKSYERSRKDLRIEKTYYIKGSIQKSSSFNSNLNKTQQRGFIREGGW